jgi:hypothetical protein
LWPSEKLVEVKLPDGKVFTAPVDSTQVSYGGNLEENQSREGHVKVRIVMDSTPTSVYIDLPGQDIMLGSRVEVPIDFLKRPDPNTTQP